MSAQRFAAVPFKTVEEVLKLSIVDWSRIYALQTPLKLNGLVKLWPAVSCERRKWSNLLTLKERIQSGNIVPIESGGTYMDENMTIHHIDVTDFISYLNAINENEHSKSESQQMYLAQQEISTVSSLLEEDIKPRPEILLTGKGHLYRTNIWLGFKSTSPCHHDPFQNILCQVFGTKNVVLFSPEQRSQLYPAYGTLQKNTSTVDILNPDFQLHPLFRKATGYSCSLSAGDALFIPKVQLPFIFNVLVIHYFVVGMVALLLDSRPILLGEFLVVIK